MVLTTIIDINERSINRMQAFLKKLLSTTSGQTKTLKRSTATVLRLKRLQEAIFDTLKALNRLPDDVPWIQEELKRENAV